MKKLVTSFKKFLKNINFKDLDNDNQSIFVKNDQFLIKACSLTIVATSSLSILWLSLAKTDEVIIASGRLIPKGEVKKVMSPTSGIIEEIYVREGEIVQEGQNLLLIDNKVIFQKNETLRKNLKSNQFLIKKTQNEIDTLDSIYFDQLSFLKNKISINKKILEKYKYLFNEGAIAELDFLRQKSIVNELETDLLEKKISYRKTKINLLDNLEKLKQNNTGLDGQLKENNIIKEKKLIKSQVEGYVFDLKPKVNGYIASTAEVLLKIVPTGFLEAYVEVPSSDIGFVNKGMLADISIDSYPSSDFGIVEGEIIEISKDALPPNPKENRNLYFYPVKVKLEKQNLQIDQNNYLGLQAGMTIKANIKLRKVSYLRLILSNFKDKTRSINKL
ncbi:HlyD family secretion protein [uncultured Prochlorococcus sp.]|uniref:HlyD family secretion protein n=1 Tax=uncultured Prochlorococcus sp. TaxID=159733 RepID=UPI0025898575|nr:HlyD family efflux transporter periplasmic adaptor subunit [uncultured Prochlorococcus sp.]